MDASALASEDIQPFVDVDAVQAALKVALDTDSDCSRAVQEILKDPSSISDPRLLKLLAGAVAQGLRISPSTSPVCMHAHGLHVATDRQAYAGHSAEDGGPIYEFTAVEDTDPMASEPYYSAGVMISTPKFRLLRLYPSTVFFYVIVDGPYRGVRLCTLAVIESLGFKPEYPTPANSHPTCRAFFTAGEAYHYLHEALSQRGLITHIPRPWESTTVAHSDAPAVSGSEEGSPAATPDASPVISAAPLVAWGPVELARDKAGYFARE